MKQKPRVLIFAGYGLNCEEETQYAFESAGAAASIVHVNDIIDGHVSIREFQILAFPGGFSYGDDLGSGNAFANKLRHSMGEEIFEYVTKDTLVIGICNGFQILTNLGLLPALYKTYGNRQVALLHNTSARYTVRWVDVKVDNNTPWLAGAKHFMLPIAHGEGRFYADEAVMKKIKKEKLVSLRYTEGEICEMTGLPYNPNGATDDIAGITDGSGRVLGLMPHPERAISFTQLPYWTLTKEQYARRGKKLPDHGPGFKLFQNAVKYFN